MKTRRIYYLFSLLIVIHSTVVCSQQNSIPTFTSLSIKDGLTQGIIHSIHQDKKGFMWFGTVNGLNRFDGYEFQTFKHSKSDTASISNDIINCIVEDNEGNLWIGTQDGLNCYNPVTESFKTYKNNLQDEKSVSNNYVKSLFLDEYGVLWVGTDMYLNRYNKDTDDFTQYDFGGFLKNTRIFDIHKDAYNDMWLATRSSGLIRFNPETFDYEQYSHDPKDANSLSDNYVSVIYEDSRKQLWFGTWEHGVCTYNRKQDSFNRIPVNKDGTGLNNNQIRCIAENRDGHIWIGTFEGLNIYNPETQTFQYCLRHNNMPGSLSYNTVNYIYRDRTGSMWLGTHGGGVNMHNYQLEQFHLINPKSIKNHDYGSIGPLVEYNNKIWIGTDGGGLACYDIESGDYQYFNLYEPSRGAMNSNTIKTLCIDQNAYLWLGTYAGGVLTFDTKNKEIKEYYDSFDGINNNIVFEIFEDSKGNIWVGSNTNEGIHIKKHDSDRFIPGINNPSDSQRIDLPYIRVICEPLPNELWFGSMYYGLFIYKEGKGIRNLSVSNSNLSSDYISVVMKDYYGKIWIGTYGGGLNIYDPKTDEIKSLTTADGLLNDNVCAIIEDNFGSLWVSTLAGISQYEFKSGTFTNYSFNKNGFPIEALNLKSGLRGSDGQLYFGGNNGLVHFYPQLIVNNKYNPPVVITHLSVNNKPASFQDNNGIMKKSISYSQGITLNHIQAHNVSFEFAALNYIFPGNNQYMFYLDGYESEWGKPGFQRQATYTNLPAGKYILKIKASNNSGIWNEDYLKLEIRVLPPPWRTWWAYTLYFILFGSLAYAVIYYFISRIKLRNDIKVKQMEKQAIEQAHQMRMNMFTNFAHELRTPLTLVLNPIKKLLLDTSLSDDTSKASLQTVYKNANRMLSLVNQLLDLRKQEAGKIKLRVKETDMVKFIREIVLLFRELAGSKRIKLEFQANENTIPVWFDSAAMEKVIYNLLSNAIKNTPENGTIIVDVSLFKNAKEDNVEITVNDTGAGIPEKDLENVFKAFYQVDENPMVGTYGTGLGLHISETIVQQHHGVISVENRVEGGACFRIVLPMNKGLFTEEEFADNSPNYVVNVNTVKDYQPNKPDAKETISNRNKPIILIVDDNADIRQFMKSELQKYITYEAENGAVAWELAENIIPDIIVSDIMMPVMDGLELCRKVKNHIKTSHIPVILLTARTSILQIEEGLKTGADDYITKPFDADLLKIRIHNMVENRKKAKLAYLNNFAIEIPTPKAKTLDNSFLNRAYDWVKKNMNNPDLSIEEFGKQLNLSRTQLFRKIKALTGMSPSLFVSTLRLKYAAELLSESSLTISEISWQVGFNNLSYFTSSFKKLYNATPTEYRQQNQKIPE